MERQKRKNKGKPQTRSYPQGKTEVYAYKDDNGQEQWIDVVGLRAWANENLEMIGIPIDMHHVEDIFASDAIDKDHLKSNTLPNPDDALPILVCLGLIMGRDQIVDGNHTYVAIGMSVALAQREGIQLATPPAAPGYAIPPEVWERFVIPPECGEVQIS